MFSFHCPPAVFACALLAATSPALAVELKVDISNTSRPVSEGNDPAYTPWPTLVSGNTSAATFDGVTVTFARPAASAGTALESNYWKAGVQDTTLNIKLTADGLKVSEGDAGAQIEMRLAGLSAGAHSVLLYLNNWDGPTSNAPLDISVNGTQVVDNLPVSTRVTDNNNATTAYLNFTATTGQDVVILIKAETTGSETYKNVHLNGFEIDVPNVKGQANNPVPAHADEHVNADTGSITLQWGTAVLGAASHNVYFGTSESAITNAAPASPEYKGNQTANTYPVSGINPHLTYYWRVDEVTAGGTVVKGNVWMFRPRRLAFPGAEGWGRFARGGRGGVVRHVTNLNDSGPGSLRDAIEGDYGPRTVIFDVSGLITLNSDIIIDGTMPYITVAGQTAPGKGICIKREQFAMSGSRDVVFRYLRLLVGKESGATQNATGMAGVDHCIMDHVSAGWGIDEGLSSRGAKNMTFQRSSLSEALNIAGHKNYPEGTAHGYAASIGGDVGSFHHNLLAHNEGRNWSLAGGLTGDGYFAGRMDITNNVVYNWGGRTTDGGAHEVNFVNNYYKPTVNADTFIMLTAQHDNFPGTQQYYFAGNVLPGRVTEANQPAGRAGAFTNDDPYAVFVNAPFFPSYVTTQSATNAYKQVLSDVGCNLPQIDNRDARIINETLNGTTTYTGSVSGKIGMPDTTADVGGWENYGNETRPAGFDSDGDGMPDWWETTKGLNPNSAANDFTECNADPDGDGYTHLEDYLNWMATPHVDVNAGAFVDVDLQVLSVGYSKTTPAYTFVGSSLNGTTTLVTGRYARFTPSTTANALGAFTYTVTDSAGDSMTRTVNVRIVGSGVAVPPAAPAGLSAVPDNAQVTLSWSAVADATGYSVKRSTVSGGPYAEIGTTAGTNFINTGLSNGTTYYYVVSAVNAAGEGVPSGQVSAVPQIVFANPPAAPAGLSATAANAQVALTWSAAANASSYNIKRAIVGGGPYATVGTATSTSFTNTGLTNGTTYYFVVSAVNNVGESANSPQASATPAVVLGAPVGLVATSSNSQVTLTWTALSGAVTYNVKRATVSGGPYTIIASPTGASYINTGLTNGRTYYYVVSAVNTAGESPNSTQASATPALITANPPLAYAGYNDAGAIGTAIANNTVSGGTGWTGNYGVKPTSTTYPFPYYTTGLTYSDAAGALSTAGNALRIGADTQTSTNTQQYMVQHVLPSTLGATATAGGGTTGTLWISYLIYNPAYTTPSGFYREATFNFVSGSPTSGGSINGGTVQGAVGMPNTSATVSPNWTITTIRTDNGQTVSSTQSTRSAFSSSVQLVVIRMDIDTTTATTLDRMYVWVNPPLGTEPSVASALLTNTTINLDVINAFRWQGNGYSGTTPGAIYTVDELRLGRAFADVTPTIVSTPTVTLAATDSTAGEFGADQSLAFTVTRTGATTSALAVPLVASGSATSGVDYTGFSGSITIPAGQTSATVTLTVLSDSLAEGSETVTLALGTSASFTAGTPSSVTVSITDQPAEAYYASVIADPAKRGPTDDADGDGTPNLLEYFFGSSPASGSDTGSLTLPSADPAANTLTLRFPRAKNHPDAAGTLQWSSDLSAWFTSGQSDGTRTVTFSNTVISAPDVDPEIVETTATVSGPSGDTPRVFVRLSVQ